MFKLVIFDLDGTLIDSMSAIMGPLNLTFSELGLGPYEWKNDIERFFGKTFDIWAETLLKEGGKFSKENLKMMIDKMWDNYYRSGIKEIKLQEGTEEILEFLKKKGVKMAVATNMITRHAETILSRFNISEYFEKVCTASDLSRGKPHTDQFECIMKNIKAEKNEILMVGDSETDIEFARNCGISMALLESPWNRSIDADYNIKKLTELAKIA